MNFSNAPLQWLHLQSKPKILFSSETKILFNYLLNFDKNTKFDKNVVDKKKRFMVVRMI